MRVVSELLATLIVIALTIGACIVAVTIISGILQKHAPKGTDLIISGTGYTTTNTLVVKLTLVVSGSDPVSINTVEIYKGTTKITPTSSTTLGCSRVYPGSNCELVVKYYGVSTVNSGDTLTVLVYWTDIISGASGVSRGTVSVS